MDHLLSLGTSLSSHSKLSEKASAGNVFVSPEKTSQKSSQKKLPESPGIGDSFRPQVASTPMVKFSRPQTKSSGVADMEVELLNHADGKSAAPKRKSTVRTYEDVELTSTSRVIKSEENMDLTFETPRRSFVINPAHVAANRKSIQKAASSSNIPKAVSKIVPKAASSNVPKAASSIVPKDASSNAPKAASSSNIPKDRSRQLKITFPVKKPRRGPKSKTPTRQVTPDVAGPSKSRTRSQSRGKVLKIVAEMTDESTQENIVRSQKAAQAPQATKAAALQSSQQCHVLLENLDVNSMLKKPQEVAEKAVETRKAVNPTELHDKEDQPSKENEKSQRSNVNHEEIQKSNVNNEKDHEPNNKEGHELNMNPPSAAEESSEVQEVSLPASENVEFQVEVNPRFGKATPAANEKQQGPKPAIKRKLPVKVAKPHTKKAKPSEEKEDEEYHEPAGELDGQESIVIPEEAEEPTKSQDKNQESNVSQEKVQESDGNRSAVEKSSQRSKPATKRKQPVEVDEPLAKKTKSAVLLGEEEEKDETIPEPSVDVDEGQESNFTHEEGQESNENQEQDQDSSFEIQEVSIEHDSGVSHEDSEDADLSDVQRRLRRRPLATQHPYWINDGSAKNYTITYGVSTVKEEMQLKKAKELMARHHITERMLQLPSIIRLPANEITRRVKLFINERKRVARENAEKSS